MTARRCQVSGHALLTGTNLYYVRIGHGEDFERYRLRFCRVHSRLVQEDLTEFEVNPEDGTLSGGDDSMAKCFSCGEPVDESGAYLFLTCYPSKNERKDYWSRLHVDCSIGGLLEKGDYAE